MDPIGKAIEDYIRTRKPADIIVSSDICEDDIIPVEVLFRTYEEMPELEQIALKEAKGSILDVGAGAGTHAQYLTDLGEKVLAIDISKGAVDFMKKNGLDARQQNFFDLENHTFDTILMLMNGIGIAGSLANLEATLEKGKELLNDGGSIICDSSDIKYLYEDDEGGLWMNLNSEYYGNFKFQMSYKKEKGEEFEWLYVDFDNLFQAAKNVGMKAVRIYEKDNNYLAKITKND
jgi:SAM-dependent methyltransferase